MWCNIKSIRREKESNEVFNLSVNEEHSYNVYGIAVHNCQPFSCAGSRKGAEDDRYLWPEVLRGVDEIRPNWFIGENVAGITSMVLPGDEIKVGSYTDLEGESYLETEMRQQFIVDRICNDLESIGYSVQPIIIPACAVGAPHRRDRIWFIAHGGETIANCSNARPEGMQQGENGIYEFEVTADTTSTIFQERFILDRREDEKETGTRGGTMNINDMAKSGLLPTPIKSYWKAGTPKDRNDGKTRNSQLNHLIAHHAGKTSHLNPRFAAEMMGFPPNYLELPFLSIEQNP